MFIKHSNSQTISFKYSIDSNIKEQIDSNFTQRNIGGYVEYKKYENDSLIIDTYGKNEIIRYDGEPKLTNDTLGFVLSGPDEFITIFNMYKDSCHIQLIALDGLIESYKELDSLGFVGGMECEKISVTLVSKPILIEGEFVEGIIELTTENYVNFRDDKLKKLQSQMRTYFKITVPKPEKINR